MGRLAIDQKDSGRTSAKHLNEGDMKFHDEEMAM